MPDLKISQLAAGTTPLAGTELVPIVQSGVTSRTTVQAIMTSTVPSGTANGVLYLNGSKVATSGSALTFSGTRLDVTVPTAYVGRFAYDATYYTDIGYGGINTVAPSNPFRYWELNGSEQMRLTSTGLGIGTTPSYKLHVTVSAANTAAAAIYNTDASNGNGLYVKAGGSNSGKYALAIDNAASSSLLYLDSSGNLIQTAPTTPPTLSTNGTMVFNLTSNTNLRVSVRGSDGVTRVANLTLA